MLQHAWASISHKLDYKAASEAPTELRRQLFRLSALLELADEDFASLRDRSKSIADQYRREVNLGQLDIPLNHASLTQYLKEGVDLRYWAELGRKAGMDWNEETYKLLRADLEVSPLLTTLQVVGVSNIAEFQSLLEEIRAKEPTALELLREFVELRTLEDGEVSDAVGADNLVLLVSFFRAEKIPPNFDWGGIWVTSVERVLRAMVEKKVSSS